MAELHVVPRGDLIDHDRDSWACVCGPAIEARQHATNNGTHWDALITHHALDGRA